jgi:Phosphodiester glycosidase
VPRSVPPRHWYDENLQEHGQVPGTPEPGERDQRAPEAPAGPSRSGAPGASYDGASGDHGREASYGPGGYRPDAPYQEAAGYRRDDQYGGAPGNHAGNDPYGRGPADDGQNGPYGHGPRDYTRDDAYDPADMDYAQDGPSGRADYGPRAPNGHGQAGRYQGTSYNRGGSADHGQDTLHQGGPAGYDRDNRYQGVPAGYRQDHHQGGRDDDGPDGQQPGDDGPRTPHRHNKRGQADKPRRPRLPRRLLSHRSVQVVLVALIIFLGWVGWSVGQALMAPGNGTVSTRLAEWARDHYLGPVVTFGEWLTYQAPKVGGKPQFSLTAPTTGSGRTAPKRGTASITPIVPARLSSPAGAPLAGEGQWRVLASVNGVPAIYGTYLRPDSMHTSYVAGIASMDQRLLTFQLRPGTEDPGPGNWGYSPWLPPNSRNGLLATFNSGFRLNAAGGGFYLNGHTKGVLTNGAASLVYYRNGRVAIGTWGQGVSMNANVLGVRQNLKLIVDHGAVPTTVDQNVEGQWGATLGGGYYVWRSGIGITRDGRVVWVYGPALSVRTLAELLQRAGAVDGMQMDINPAWMSYMYYKPTPSAANPTPVNLLPDQPDPANRYYSVNSRDFTAVFAR